MNQNSSLREGLKSVSWMLTGNNEGYRVRAWPAVTISRGEVIARYHDYTGGADRGRFVPAKQTPVQQEVTEAQAELAAFGATLSV